MATINKLSKLFSALSERDSHRAEAVASEIVRDEERKGHHGAARLLRGSLQPNNTNSSGMRLNPPVSSAKLLSDALSPQDSRRGLDEIVLSHKVRTELEEVAKEWHFSGELAKAGIKRRSRLLFHGPPGCGKSLTAKALGLELSLPTYVVRFDGVIGAYLGQTAIHLRELFRFAQTTSSVLVFDEVDALGKRRGNLLDVGEFDRIVIAFMQELEHSDPAGFVIATSNLPQELDNALWRRFDFVAEFPRPSTKQLSSFFTQLFERHKLKPSTELKSGALKCKSYAEAERLVEARVRQGIIGRPHR